MKNFVLGAEIDPKNVLDASTFKIGGWNIFQHIHQNLLEEFIGENEP